MSQGGSGTGGGCNYNWFQKGNKVGSSAHEAADALLRVSGIALKLDYFRIYDPHGVLPFVQAHAAAAGASPTGSHGSSV